MLATISAEIIKGPLVAIKVFAEDIVIAAREFFEFLGFLLLDEFLLRLSALEFFQFLGLLLLVRLLIMLVLLDAGLKKLIFLVFFSLSFFSLSLLLLPLLVHGGSGLFRLLEKLRVGQDLFGFLKELKLLNRLIRPTKALLICH